MNECNLLMATSTDRDIVMYGVGVCTCRAAGNGAEGTNSRRRKRALDACVIRTRGIEVIVGGKQRKRDCLLKLPYIYCHEKASESHAQYSIL